MCLCWEEARIFVIFSEGTLNHWGRKGSILCFFIRTQESWNADKSRCSELAQPTKTSRSLWFASWERLTYKVPTEEGGDSAAGKPVLSPAGEHLAVLPLSPAEPLRPPPQPWRISRSMGSWSIPGEPLVCFWGRCQQSRCGRSDFWSSFYLFVSHPVFSFWVFLGLRSGLIPENDSQMVLFCWLLYKHTQTFILINGCKNNIGEAFWVFFFPDIFILQIIKSMERRLENIRP